MTIPTVSAEDINKLRELYPKFHTLSQTLEKVVHPDISKQIKDIMAVYQSVFEPIQQAEDAEWQIKFDAWGKIADDNKFISTLSMYELPVDLENHEFPHAVKQFSYQGVVKTFDKPIKLNYMDVWHIANQLIVESKDRHHIYIEYFNEIKPGYFELITGS